MKRKNVTKKQAKDAIKLLIEYYDQRSNSKLSHKYTERHWQSDCGKRVDMQELLKMDFK